MSKQIHLVLIDFQHDFCATDGALCVPGAHEDAQRIAQMIRSHGSDIKAIHLTLDSHDTIHIAHPVMWKNPTTGERPAPFTEITLEAVQNGEWTTYRDVDRDRAIKYLEKLAQRTEEAQKAGLGDNVYPLTIWPPHCLIGSQGWSVYKPVFDAVNEWETTYFRKASKITKGSNPYTEHYSALKAEVPDARDHSTQLNAGFVEVLEQADEVLIAGEASSHCVRHTVIDIAEAFSDPQFLQKVTLLTDAMSPVVGFEAHAKSFIDNMVQRGMKGSVTTEAFATAAMF